MDGSERSENKLSKEKDAYKDTYREVTDRIRERAYRIEGQPGDYEPLLARIGDAQFVLLGEASHGTHEFYQARAEITRRLITEKGFTAVAVEADWPDAYRINRYVQGSGEAQTSLQALSGFERFPTWMWRNTDVLNFITWLHDHNQGLQPGQEKAGFYGLDLYSLFASIEAVINYLDKVDPAAAQRARYRYSCFEHFGEDPQTYGYAASFDLTPTCETEVLEQLRELNNKAFEYVRRDGFVAQDEYFFAEQNARIARNAEQYYRAMFGSDVTSWNLRDRHMMETLVALADHLEKQGMPAKIVVWEHNSHLGDARATEMSRRGELNVGQLVRERYGQEAVLVGFTTYSGTVTAASNWGAEAERKRVLPALKGSVEDLFHATEVANFLLLLDTGTENIADLEREMLERAIGVIYRPETERVSHYFFTRLMDQFNSVIHFDQTTAVDPLDKTQSWETGEPPETFPTGI